MVEKAYGHCPALGTGDCKEILTKKYPDTAKEIVEVCMKTLKEIVEFTKGPKPDKTKCDRLCFATSTSISASVPKSRASRPRPCSSIGIDSPPRGFLKRLKAEKKSWAHLENRI